MPIINHYDREYILHIIYNSGPSLPYCFDENGLCHIDLGKFQPPLEQDRSIYITILNNLTILQLNSYTLCL